VDRFKNGVFEHYGTEQGLPNDYVDAVLCDRNHTLWAGTWGGGLCRMQGNRFVPFDNPGECSGVVCALFEDSRGSLWLGQQRAGPEIVHLDSGKPVVFQLQSRLTGTDVRALAEMVTGETPTLDPAPVAPGRFGARTWDATWVRVASVETYAHYYDLVRR